MEKEILKISSVYFAKTSRFKQIDCDKIKTRL